jgi:uncharacterized protein
MVVLLVVVAGYLMITAVAAERLTRPARPDAGVVAPAGPAGRFQDVTLRSADDRVDLAAWVLPVAGSEVGVVLVHGIDADRARAFGGGFPDLAAALQDAGYQVVMIDLRGHGASGPGHSSFGLRERYDVIAAVDHLVRERGVRPGHVGVVGASLGAAAAIGAAAVDTRIGAVWSDSAFAEVYPVVVRTVTVAGGLPTFFLPGMRLMYRLRFGIDLVTARPADAVPTLAPRPLSIVHGTTDSVVPLVHASVLADAAPWADVWIVEGAGHTESYSLDRARYTARVIEFLDLALRSGLAAPRPARERGAARGGAARCAWSARMSTRRKGDGG